MKSIGAALAFVLVLVGSGCASETAGGDERTAGGDEGTASTDTALAGYDSLLAQELGADDYGMAKYVVAFLKAGPNRGQDSARAVELQRAHMDNITRMAEEGQLLTAGPFLDAGSLRGIYVFDVETVEEARALTETDPAIQAGRLEMELHPWYGPAALRGLKDLNDRITRQSP